MSNIKNFTIGNILYIPLIGKNGFGLCAIIDVKDEELVLNKKWHIGTHGYPVNRGVLMHSLFKNKDWEIVDHINSNKLDNRRINLRGASRFENARNSRKRRSSSQLYKGMRQTGPSTWQARIRKNGIEYYLGSFKDPVLAAKAYDAAAIKLFKDFSLTNFGEENAK